MKVNHSLAAVRFRSARCWRSRRARELALALITGKNRRVPSHRRTRLSGIGMLLAALRVRSSRVLLSLSRIYKAILPAGRDMANIVVNKTAHPFDKSRLEALLNRRFFYAPAFEIYGGM